MTVSFDTFNPFALTPSQLNVCTGLDCFPLANGSTNVVRFPFYDGGTNLSYYGWAPLTGSGANTITQLTSGGYDIAYSSGTTGAVQSGIGAYFYPQQDVQVVSNAPEGTTWTVTVSCGGQVLQDSGAQGPNGVADIFMMNLAASAAQCAPIKFGFALPSGAATTGTVHVSALGVPPLGRF